MNREFFNSLACGVHASVIAVALLVIPLSFQSCNGDDAALEVPQYELHRGTLSDISWSKSYTPREFENAFSTAIGGMDLNLLKSIGIDMGPMFGKIADGLLENQGDVLQELFDEEQGRNHKCHSKPVGSRRYCQGNIPEEHHAHTGDNALAVPYLIRKNTAEYGEKIDTSQKNGIDSTCKRSSPAELGLKEQHKDCKHCVIAEALACIGKGQGKQTFRLTFEHIIITFIV